MKYLVAVIILIVGLALGFILGRLGGDEVETVVDKGETEYVTEYVTDTIVQTETVRIPDNSDKNGLDTLELDSLALLMDDSTINLTNLADSLPTENIQIRREKKIAERTIDLVLLSEADLKDTTIKELLGIENRTDVTIFVEFWESPLHYSGYKLSPKKLILFGLSPQLDYTLYKRENDYYLHAQKVFFALQETADFLSYREVDKTVVFND